MFRLRYLLPVLWLTGCAALPARAPDEVARMWAARQQALAPVATWELRGRIALRSRDEGLQASLHWVRDGARHRIALVGPLGSGQVRLTQDADGAELIDAEKKQYRGATARDVLLRITGWDMPLESLNWWIRGLPAPGAKTEQELDGDGRLKMLVQSGWEVEFLEYDRYGANELPSKLFARRREDAPGIGRNHVTLEVRVAIERWALPDR